MQTIRLNKFIASQLVVGRRQADSLIQQGRVKVNGQTSLLGAQINPASDKVVVDDKTLHAESQNTFIYLLFNKPAGYVCSRRQQGQTPTIYALLPQNYQHLKPVGRLDKDSSGLLLLTNDGDFAHRLTHPSFNKLKRYNVIINKPLEPEHQKLINSHGVELPDGPSKLQLTQQDDRTHWQVSMHEGRNRQIRRTFAALGYEVARLHRTNFGDYTLGTLAAGEFTKFSK
jgi:23S rRNA pseudouridine2605 synthase